MRIDLKEREVFEGLTWREARFIREFFATNGDIVTAATRAGYQNSSSPISRPTVQRAMQAVFREYATARGIAAEAVLGELATIAFAPIEGSLVPIKEKIAALVWIGKHLGMFVERVNVNLSGKVEVVPCLENLSDQELDQLEGLLTKVTPSGGDGAQLPPGSNGRVKESSKPTKKGNGRLAQKDFFPS